MSLSFPPLGLEKYHLKEPLKHIFTIYMHGGGSKKILRNQKVAGMERTQEEEGITWFGEESVGFRRKQLSLRGNSRF
jgi:hypothetical protein